MTDRHLQGNQLQRLDSHIKISEGEEREELGAQSFPQVSRGQLTTSACKEWKGEIKGHRASLRVSYSVLSPLANGPLSESRIYSLLCARRQEEQVTAFALVEFMV